MAEAPKFRRRKQARPGEIVAAALTVFAEKGFAAARLEDIAALAGVSKAALYLYFETKEELFRAAVGQAAAANLDAVAAAAEAYEGSFAELMQTLAVRLAETVQDSPLPSVAKMVIGESRNFPDLARIWHDQLAGRALGLFTGLVARAQARGEVRPGDPRGYAFSLIGPMVMGALWREVLVPVGAEALDLSALARQHVDVAMNGMLREAEAAA